MSQNFMTQKNFELHQKILHKKILQPVGVRFVFENWFAEASHLMTT